MMPDTAAYYHAAYIVVALLYTGYAVSLWVRARRLRDRLHSLAQRGGESGARVGP